MSLSKRDDIAVVVRAAGERTEQNCARLAREQAKPEHVIVVHEKPFRLALRRTLTEGLRMGLPWTLGLDADTLIRVGAIEELTAIAEEATPKTFAIQGRILDRLFAGPRPAGIILYRTSMLREALACVPDDFETVRPETMVVRRMESRGYPRILRPVVLGVHDYEQYYRDLYRTAWIHGKKHLSQTPVLRKMWERFAEKEPDFQAALWGLRASLIFEGRTNLDVREFPSEIDGLLHAAGLEEKTPLGPEAISAHAVSDWIAAARPPAEYAELMRVSQKNADSSSEASAEADNFFRLTYRRLGWARFVPWFAGRALTRTGQTLERWVEKK